MLKLRGGSRREEEARLSGATFANKPTYKSTISHQIKTPSRRDTELEKRPIGTNSTWLKLKRLSRVSSMLSCLGHLLLALSLFVGASEHISAATVAPASSAEVPASNRAAALEAELNSLLQQHDTQDGKLLSEAIISRLMLGNLSDSGDLLGGGGAETADLGDDPSVIEEQNEEQQASLPGPDVVRLRKLMSYLHNYEMSQAASGLNGGQVFSQYPVLPASQASTIKRASVKMGNYLKQQAGGRQAAYGRNNFDFGLGKRPDSSVSSNVLRFGDSLIGANGHVVSGSLGKRPSAHRFDFGLGKRVASVSSISDFQFNT